MIAALKSPHSVIPICLSVHYVELIELFRGIERGEEPRGGQSDKSLPIWLAARPSITHLRGEGRKEEGGNREVREEVGRAISLACFLPSFFVA